jgi:AcrR family transcriptional regulator
MGVKERQERERLATREAILEAAQELFLSQGYSNVSMRKIAEKIEYSPAAIYSYFKSKDEIFFSLAEDGYRRMADRVNRVVTGTVEPLEALRRGIWAFYEFSKENPDSFYLMFLDRSVPDLAQDIERFEFIQQTMARGEAAIRSLIDSGRFQPTLEPAAAVHILWAAMIGPAAVGIAGRLGPGESPDALARDVLESVLAGFAAGISTSFTACECPLRASAHNGDVRPTGADHDHATQS